MVYADVEAEAIAVAFEGILECVGVVLGTQEVLEIAQYGIGQFGSNVPNAHNVFYICMITPYVLAVLQQIVHTLIRLRIWGNILLVADEPIEVTIVADGFDCFIAEIVVI